MSVRLPQGFCNNCGTKIRVMAFQGDDACSVDCKQALAACEHRCRGCGCRPELHDPNCPHNCSGWFDEDPPTDEEAAELVAAHRRA